MRFLVGFGHHRQVFDLVILAVVREPLFGPGFDKNIERLDIALLILFHHDIGRLIQPGVPPPYPALDPALGQNVGFCDFAGQYHGVMQRQRVTQRAEANLSGPLGQGAIQGQRIGVNGELFKERMFERGENGEPVLVGMNTEGDHVLD